MNNDATEIITAGANKITKNLYESIALLEISCV